MPLGVEGSSGGMRAKIDGDEPGSLAELALVLPVQIIDPEVHRLIEEGPSRRRRFLDWGVFHVEPNFVGHWQRYQQALQAAKRGTEGRPAASRRFRLGQRSGPLWRAARAQREPAM